MMKLVEENVRLRELLQIQASQSNSRQTPKTDSPLQNADSNKQPLALNPITSQSNTSRDFENSESRLQSPHNPSPTTLSDSRYDASVRVQAIHFHGPSSVMFDEGASREGPSSGSNLLANSQAKNQLLADTTRQRKSRDGNHIERYNALFNMLSG